MCKHDTIGRASMQAGALHALRRACGAACGRRGALQLLCTRSVRAREHTGVGTSSPGQRGDVCGRGLVTACAVAAGGCIGRRRAPAAAVDWRFLVAERSGRAAAPGPGHGPAAVAGGDCLVGGHRSLHASRHAAERTGPPLGALVHLRAMGVRDSSKNSHGGAAPRAGAMSGAADAADGTASGPLGAGPGRGRATGWRAGACSCPSPIDAFFVLNFFVKKIMVRF